MNNKQSQKFYYSSFYVFLRHESPLYSVRYTFSGTRHHRHFPAVTAYYSVSAAHSRPLCTQFPRLYNRLLHHKYLGSYIRNFRENKAIPLRAKIISVSLIWITILNCIFFIVPYWWLKAVLLLIAAGTSYHILSFKTLK
jgi:uncharacterized membrane protein YbaN (DUF454 family)